VPTFAGQLESELAALAQANRLRACPELEGPSRTVPSRLGKALVSFASNDYLGLASHPALANAAAGAAASQGFGGGAARLVSGDLPAHRDLEAALAQYLEAAAVLLFSTGYQANVGVLTALAGPQDLIVSDAANHASVIDGCRLSRATVRIYPHLDANAARAALAHPGSYRRRLLVTESLFSMDGDEAPLAQLAATVQEQGGILIVDEAHALGVLGPGGRGLCAEAGVVPDVLVGTLGKAFGSFGGFVAGGAPLRAFLVNRARTFIYTTAMPPPIAAASMAAARLIAGPEGDQRRARFHSNVGLLAEALFEVLSPPGQPGPPPRGGIFPVIVGSDERALAVSRGLVEHGFFVPAIRPPTVPEGAARLRVTISSDHQPIQIRALARALTTLL
jgi:8-amino-7-oxononanoate synthase